MNSILIVDDHSDIRRLIRMTLEFAGRGTEVSEASDGETGLAMARALRPDVVITDVMMPGSTNGLSLCQTLKSDPEMSGTAIIMISAKGRAEDRLAGLEAGAEAYLVKPFSPLELVKTLERLGVCA
ncbi:MAG: response regulator [Variovorax sp.]|jgi:two-component system phosphate regulon response regulator PhoB|nr:MAG: response regulator [Variovorax sp.]